MPPSISALALLCLFLTSASAQPPASGPGEFYKDLAKLGADAKGSRAEAGLAPFVEAVERALARAEKAGPERRDDAAERALSDLNAAARRLDESGSSEKKVRALRRGLARLNLRARNWHESERQSSKNLHADPQDRDALVDRATAYYGMGNYRRALDDAGRAATMEPPSASAFTARALAAYGLGRYLQALEDARRALALDPDDRTAFSLMKLAEGRVRATPSGAERGDLHAAEDVQREYEGMLRQMCQVEERTRHPVLEGSAAVPDADGLLRGAAAKIAARDYAGALEAAELAVARRPSPEAYYHRAAAKNLLGKYREAVEDASQALAMNPNDPAARDARAWAYYRLGQYRDAVSDENHSLELDPANAYAYANRGYAHEKLGDVAAMLADLKAAAGLNPQFEPAFRQAAALSSIAALPAAPRRPQPERKAAATREVERRLSWAVLASSAGGGILILAGLLQLAGGKESRPATGRSRRHEPLESTYRIVRVIGEGGMGVVYEAEDRSLNRKVAIKRLRSDLERDPAERERFLAEARIVAALHHPAIVDIHSILQDAAGFCLVFELVEGRSLDELLADKGRLPIAQAREILKGVCEALSYAHARRIVHRDLKPSNIMIADDGSSKVMDFGIARQGRLKRDGAATPPTEGFGTPPYMAPEHHAGDVRPESDVFSLGACLYEMVCGRRPFDRYATAEDKTTRRYLKPTQLDPSLPPAFDALIDAALEPDPETRIPTAREFWARLELLPSI